MKSRDNRRSLSLLADLAGTLPANKRVDSSRDVELSCIKACDSDISSEQPRPELKSQLVPKHFYWALFYLHRAYDGATMLRGYIGE